MTGLTLRSAGPADHPALRALKRRSAMTIEADRAFLAAHPEAAEEIDFDTLAITLVEDQGRLAGFAGFTRVSSQDIELAELFVDPEFMGRGIGRSLVNLVADNARQTGCANVIVDANPAAIPFYRALGFADAPQNPEHAGKTLNLPLL